MSAFALLENVLWVSEEFFSPSEMRKRRDPKLSTTFRHGQVNVFFFSGLDF